MEHRLGDDPQGHENIVPLEVDPRSLEEGNENIFPPKVDPRSLEEGHAVARIPSNKKDYRHSKVPHRLRQVNQTAYEPELVSIGPCHRHKEHLRQMEGIKMQYFDRVFNKKGEETKNKCFEAISKMEKEVRDWYEAYVDGGIDTQILVEMMVVDGCFIIELLCKEPQDQIAKLHWSRIALFSDLLLLENQLPFFVLVQLYGLITQTDGTDFAPKAFAKLIEILPVSRIETENRSTINDTNKIDHLLGLVHDNWLPFPQRIDRHKGSRKPMERQSIGCARELEEAGIEFINVDSNEKTFFDVTFTDGKMKIPTFVIGDDTERLFRNLIAYELFVQGSTYVIDYVSMMDNLVNTANDVQLLRSSGVIQNLKGNDEAVAQMLNKLLDNVTLCGNSAFYYEIIDDVKKHYDRRWNTWKATLMRYYFNDPLALNNLLIAIVSLYVTIILSIISFYKH